MRKSRELRLSQAIQLVEDYTKLGLANDYRMRFVRDMISRLDRGKGLSKKQRSWLDSLIENGSPTPQGDPVLIKKIQDAIELDGMQRRSQVLQDFCGQIVGGRRLSEKQQSFLDIMLAEAAKIMTHGKFRPTDLECLEDAVAILGGKNDWYFAHRGGTAKALRNVNDWLEWHRAEKDLAQSSYDSDLAEPPIDEWSCSKVLDAVKGSFRQLNEIKHPTGEMRYVRRGSDKSLSVIVITDPYICRIKRQVCQDVLVDGDVIIVRPDEIRKRR